MNYPNLYKLRQIFSCPTIENVAHEVVRELSAIPAMGKIRPGDTIAITAGSRGIADIALVLKSLIERLKQLEARPFIIPAMGSHGGGSADGQKGILAHYGITEAFMNAPIKATMRVIPYGKTPEGISVFVDELAAQADWIVPVNRIKPHTDYSGDIESGLLKMLAIGLGKKVGADYYHKNTIEYGYGNIMVNVGRTVLDRAPILFGLGLVENCFHQLAHIKAVTAEEMEVQEKMLLSLAKKYLAKIPFEIIDLLIVDEIGKDISGIGMDSNVTGRALTSEKTVPWPKVKRIFARDLSEGTEGNANGIGLVDFVTKRLTRKIDFDATYLNCLTGMFPEAGKIPMTFENDREAVDAAFNTIGSIRPEQTRVVWIKNTSCLETLIASEALLENIDTMQNIEILENLGPISFIDNGDLASLF